MIAVPKPVRWLLLPALLLTQACGESESEKTYTVRFSPQVREQTLACGTSYTDIGTSRSVIELLDFKLYVRDVTLVRANGERHVLALEQDGTWQREGVALLDFEDGTGTCDTGSPQVHTAVVGTAPEHDDYTGLEFKVGVPPELNHLDGATAAAPLNVPGMWWSWKGGYKFLRLDVRSRGNDAFVFHLGATGCSGDVSAGFSCTAGNEPAVVLADFDPDTNQVVLDAAGLLSELDVDQAANGTTDMAAGCMSSATDPECPAFFKQVGLAVDGTALTLPRTFFRSR